jgi:integrase
MPSVINLLGEGNRRVGTPPVTSYEAGVPLPYIRDILGHVDLSTTEIYARASTEAKRRALEAVYPNIVSDDMPEWNQDIGLLDWLTSL